nr:transposase [Kitasatospora phosalacinea]
MTCYKPGERSRLIYAVREYIGRRDQPKGFGWRDSRDLIIRARIQLGGPIVLAWDNLPLHLTTGMREFITTNADWLTVFQLPTHAPDLNPTEGIWSLVKRDKRRLKRIQYHPDGGRRLPRQHRPHPGPLTDITLSSSVLPSDTAQAPPEGSGGACSSLSLTTRSRAESQPHSPSGRQDPQ